MYIEDSEAWLNCPDKDLWIFNKLTVARKCGHVCGPKGVPVPKPGKYIIRPVMNVLGMGRGAKVVDLDWCTMDIPDGFFWCEVFIGRHVSVDYTSTIQGLTVEGFRRDENPMWKWDKWIKTQDRMPLPDLIFPLLARHSHFNIEYIGGKVIEVHLRHNPDWKNLESREAIPVWEGQSTRPPEGYFFRSSPDFNRLGFFLSNSL
jgi:hypothetical protein